MIQSTRVVGPPAERLGLDPAVFRGFYDDALPRVYGYFLRRTGGSPAIAEDLTQETFLAVVSELRKGRIVEAPMPWLFGIARHTLIHHYRRSERAEQPVADPEAIVDAGRGDDGRPTRDRAVTALAALPPSQRAALVLRHLEGLSVPEVADVLGKSVEAVESLLARGRVTFRRAYGEAAT